MVSNYSDIKLIDNINRIIFWEPCISPHKTDFIDQVAKLIPSIEVIYCAEENLPEERIKLGWSIYNDYEYKQYIRPSYSDIKKLACFEPKKTLHIFSGIRWVPTIVSALKEVKRSGAFFGLMSEPRVREGVKGSLRLIHSWITEAWLKKNTKFVLAIGSNGPPWFKSVGYPSSRIFPFAYFINDQQFNGVIRQHDNKSTEFIRIGYIGRLVKMKGIDDIISAVTSLSVPTKLSIIGSGPESDSLKSLCNESNVNIEFIGSVPIDNVGLYLNDFDILILASRSTDDGWGVVVSEALMSGTGVIVTSKVGASVLINDRPELGRVVNANSPYEIADAIIDLWKSKSFSKECRLVRQLWAKDKLSAKSGALNLIEIINHSINNKKTPKPFYD